MQNENSSSNSKFRSSGAELFWASLIAPMFVFQTLFMNILDVITKYFFNFQETNYILFLRLYYVIAKITYLHVKLKFFETKFSKNFTKKIRENILKDIV